MQPPGPTAWLPPYAPRERPPWARYLRGVGKAWGSVFGSFFLLIVASVFGYLFLDILAYTDFSLSHAGERLWIDLVLLATGFGLLWWKVGRAGLRQLFTLKRPRRAVLLVLLVWVLDIIIVAPAAYYLTEIAFPDAPDQVIKGEMENSTGPVLWMLVVSVVVMAPLVEETIMRGLVLECFSRVHRRWIAIILTAALFGLMHEPTAMIGAFGGGVLYGWLRMKTGSVLPCMLGHALWNGLVTAVILTL